MTKKSPGRVGRSGRHRLIDDIKGRNPISYRPSQSDIMVAYNALKQPGNVARTLQMLNSQKDKLEYAASQEEISTATTLLNTLPDKGIKDMGHLARAINLLRIGRKGDTLIDVPPGITREDAISIAMPSFQDDKEEMADLEADLYLKKMELTQAVVNEWAASCGEKIELGKPTHSAFQQLEEQEQELFKHSGKDFYFGIVKTAQIFVIQHDWSKLINDSEADTGEVDLPADCCAFEVEINKHRVIAIYTTTTGWEPYVFVRFNKVDRSHITHTMWIKVNRHDGDRKTQGTVDSYPILEKFLNDLVRASCIMLEAKVAEVEITRAPLKLNEQRLKNSRPPLRDYHTVRLDKRHRVAPADEPADVTERRRPRLHFRRSHWRHYQNYKVKIPWTLAGNEELGWVDKEYKL